MFDTDKEVRYAVYEQALRKIEAQLVIARKELSVITDLHDVPLTSGVLLQSLLIAREALE